MLKLWKPIDGVWRRLWSSTEEARPLAWPRVETVEGEGATTIRVELGEMAPDEVEVKVERDTLTIEGRHEEQGQEEGRSFQRVETFVRRMTLPANVNRDGIEATAERGIMTVILPHEAA